MISINDMMKKIRDIENKYGLLLFRMGLSHLVDVGHRNLSDEDVREAFEQIMAKAEEDTANGIMPIMTPEFQREIVLCAAELAGFSVWTLFGYVKKHVHISI